ncbi:adenylate/guanylate cyclase domain-containing protein, partial [Thermodesulfobacteriota bacterium]
MTENNFKRKLTAILSADVVGYSRLMGEDEESTVRSLNKYKELIFNLVGKNNGRVIDSPGDNVLAEFASVVDAVRCGVQAQEDLKGHNDELPPDKKMEFRIGIHTGDVIHDGDRIYGDGVNVAARIESLADSGGICISRTAYDQVKDKVNIDYDYLGEYEVKNIKEPVRVYKVLMGAKTPDKIAEDKKNVRGKSIKRNIVIATIIIIAVILVWRFSPSVHIKVEPESIGTEQATTPEVKEAPKTIAVMPFTDHSPKEDQAKFALGLSEEIITAIDYIPGLRVIGSTSSFSPILKNKTIKEKGSELGADHILEGSVSKDGNSLRILTRLISAEDGSSLWTETYTGEFKDIFSIYKD